MVGGHAYQAESSEFKPQHCGEMEQWWGRNHTEKMPELQRSEQVSWYEAETQ
jgi:hypothetical protein